MTTTTLSHWVKLEIVKECLMFKMTRSQEAGRRLMLLVNQHNLTEQDVALIFERDMMTYWKPVVETEGEEVQDDQPEPEQAAE